MEAPLTKTHGAQPPGQRPAGLYSASDFWWSRSPAQQSRSFPWIGNIGSYWVGHIKARVSQNKQKNWDGKSRTGLVGKFNPWFCTDHIPFESVVNPSWLPSSLKLPARRPWRQRWWESCWAQRPRISGQSSPANQHNQPSTRFYKWILECWQLGQLITLITTLEGAPGCPTSWRRVHSRGRERQFLCLQVHPLPQLWVQIDPDGQCLSMSRVACNTS